jgi:hypothetical protein
MKWETDLPSQNCEKLLVTFVMYVCLWLPFLMEQLCSHWKDFYEIWYLFFTKSVDKIQASLKSDKNRDTLYDMIWYDIICYDMIWYGMIRYDMVWYDMVWYDMIWYDMMISYDMIWYDMVRYDMVWYDMVWYGMTLYGMIWYDMIWCDIDIFVNCSSVDTRWQYTFGWHPVAVHIYTQTIHRTSQLTTKQHE